VENGYSEKPLNRAPIKSESCLLPQVLDIPEKVKILFSINTEEICRSPNKFKTLFKTNK